MRKYFFTCSVLVAAVWMGGALAAWTPGPTVIPGSTLERAAARAFLVLQKSGYRFVNGRSEKCASCHHTALTAMVAELAARKGIAGIDSLNADRIRSMDRALRTTTNPNLPVEFTEANFIAPYMLIGLAAAKYPPNSYTDMAVDYLMSQALPDGRFIIESWRPPLETGEIHLIAVAIHAVRLYASPAQRAHADMLVARSRQYLEKADADGQQELVFQLLGLRWCGGDSAKVSAVAKKLRSLQRSDGGWSQLSTLRSDACATGQSLYALNETGLGKDDPCYQQGLNYLLKTQDKGGTWAVETRAYAIQPFVDSDFPPFDDSQFVSAAATNWAVMAMLKALPDRAIAILEP
jgi:hypothetical protein